MQKFTMPEGVTGTFLGNAVRELGAPNPEKSKLPIKVELRSGLAPEFTDECDAFNVLDFFILSVELADFINSFSGRDWPTRRAILFLNGQKLEGDFCVLILNQKRNIGSLKATEADWLPDARYPVVPGALGDEHLALDHELKFPVVSDELIEASQNAGFRFKSLRYPHENE